MKSDRIKELEAQGWTRQFTADEPRLSEAVNMYKSMGFEVHLEPVIIEKPTDESIMGCAEKGCTACFEKNPERYKIIFTRPSKSKSNEDDDLWSE